jgi:hypothetical protein
MDAEDHAQGRGTGCRGDREQPGRGRGRVQDSLDFGPHFLGLEMAGSKLIDCPHHPSDAMHVDTGRFSAVEADQRAVYAIDCKRNLTPPYQQPRTQTECVSEPRSCRYRLRINAERSSMFTSALRQTSSAPSVQTRKESGILTDYARRHPACLRASIGRARCQARVQQSWRRRLRDKIACRRPNPRFA